MISKEKFRKALGIINIIAAVSFIGALKIFNLTLESKIFNFIQIKTLFFILLAYIGWYLIYNRDMI